jgi:hypothetical protein
VTLSERSVPSTAIPVPVTGSLQVTAPQRSRSSIRRLFWQGLFESLKRVSEGSLTASHVEFGVSRAGILAFDDRVGGVPFWLALALVPCFAAFEKSAKCDHPLAKPPHSMKFTGIEHNSAVPCTDYDDLLQLSISYS